MFNFHHLGPMTTLQETPDRLVRQYHRPDRPKVAKRIQADREALAQAGLELCEATYTGHKSTYCLVVTFNR
ncbi:hypothetical protein [Ktedonobacter robiniae]|uniref:Uncharacterized protein n=1 Tax=Ktedonobacter robiniae TaxID=2778365 RepID=A0ABQ3USD4_9CHLR|nr:hypothetical protein [Ktedonobacter robiniae]GHO55502.1 hypothetical protein KSB_39770 [Ktedonobacter robiniae]